LNVDQLLTIYTSASRLILRNAGKLWILTFRMIGFAIFLLILSRRILPWILHHLSRHIRVRSISLRSIRGLYVRVGRLTVRVERIGLSYRRRSEETTRQLSFRFQNIDIKIYPSTRRSQVSKSPRPSPIISGSLHALYTALHSINSRSSFLDALYVSVSWWLRPLFRLYFVTTGRLLIRALPSLAQLLHLEIDHLTLRSMFLAGAGIHATGLQLSLSVLFTRLEQVVTAKYPELSKTSAQFSKATSWRKPWSSRFWASASRTWEKAWGEAEGEASVNFEVDSVQSIKPSDRINDMQWHESSKGGFDKILFADAEMFLGAIKLFLSCRFNPRLVRLHRQSLQVSLNLSNIEYIITSKACNDSHPERPLDGSHSTIDGQSKDGWNMVSRHHVLTRHLWMINKLVR
jgi:hypothetical protein